MTTLIYKDENDNIILMETIDMKDKKAKKVGIDTSSIIKDFIKDLEKKEKEKSWKSIKDIL